MVRRCSPTRRQLEFDMLVHHMRKDKERFIARLQRNVKPDGDCVLWIGAMRKNGYGQMNYRFEGRHHAIQVHRVFLLLKLGRPIKVDYEAGHTCDNRHCVKHVIEQHYAANMADVHRKDKES